MNIEHTDAGGVAEVLNEKFKDILIGDASISARENDRILPKPDDELTGEKKCGDCYIFDYQEYHKSVNAASRPGSENDVKRLSHDFTALKFNVFSDFLNLTKAATLNALKTAAKKDHTQSKYFVCCFLTHGNERNLLMHDKYIKIYDILQCFTRSACETLSGKPKIFIFQACRGRCCEEGVPIDSTKLVTVKVPSDPSDLVPVKVPSDPSDLVPVKVPSDPTDLVPVKTPSDSTDFGSIKDNPDYMDFLIAYATYEGKISFKTKNKYEDLKNHGSYFIDELCRSLEQFSDKLDLLQILTIVNYRVAYLFESKYTEKIEYMNKKQMPGYASRLRTEVKFNRKIKMFESQHTRYFDERRKGTSLGVQSTEKPLDDRMMYKIRNSKSIKFLLLLNTKDNFEKDLTASAIKLWDSVANRGYKREDFRNWSEKKLMTFLNKFKSQDFSDTDCLICFIACKAKGDSLYDYNGNKFLMKNIVEQFTGEKCQTLLQKPKIFVFLLTSPDKKSFWPTWWPCVSAESTDGESSRILVPEHADILEIAITIKETGQLKGVTGKFCDIFEGESSDEFLSQLTRMNAELVKDYGFYSPFDKNLATFCLNSTLTKALILNN